VPKVQHKPIKRLKLGFKRKEQKKPKRTLVWRTGLSGVPSDSVRCNRVNRLQTLHLRVSEAALRYNSTDCPVGHQTVRCASGATARQRNGRLISEQCVDSSLRVRAAPEGAPDSEQWLSGAAPDCPMAQAFRAPTVETIRTLTVGWHGWRTGQFWWRIGLSGAPINSSPPQRLFWWLGL
jgi:hypothetical protein